MTTASGTAGDQGGRSLLLCSAHMTEQRLGLPLTLSSRWPFGEFGKTIGVDLYLLGFCTKWGRIDGACTEIFCIVEEGDVVYVALPLQGQLFSHPKLSH